MARHVYAASVWPGRTRHAPFLARSGKMCPGRARSCGFVGESTAGQDWSRDPPAEIPVVTPRPRFD